MPLQLIHTSAPHLLNSNSAGYGTVARSEQLPRALHTRLTALSILREPRGGRATTGPQYSYTILTQGESIWHVLTCTQNAGADYSGRICHIAHHLILSLDEVRSLHDHPLRPTPAGLMLALQNNGFWKSKWEEAPRYLTEKPTLSPGDMPSGESQPTWKNVTGHKANARLFFTPPFERDCLITLAPGTPSATVLSLFHESDWLTHSRGWGTSFTTEADDADSFTETLRMVTVPGSPLVQRAMRTGHPVLNIEPGMQLPPPAPTSLPPQSHPLQPGTPPRDNGEMLRSLSRTAAQYHYIEEPDWLMYDVRPTRRRWPYITAGIAGIAALALTAWILYPPAGSSTDDDNLAQEVQAQELSSDHVLLLSRLLASPYNHEQTEDTLAGLSHINEQTPEDTLLLEAVALLRNASLPGVRHAQTIKRLCECARLLGLKDSDLVRLYLCEATSNTTPEEWQQQFDGSQLTDWLALKQREPQILGLLESDELRAYMPREQATEATLLATAATSTPEQDDEPPAPPPPGRISLIPSTAVTGMALPAEVEAAIATLPVSITTGSYVVSSFTKGGELQPPQRLELSPNGYRLYITHAESDGEITLKPEHSEGRTSPVPASTIKIRKGKLQSIRCNGQDAVVCFPIPANKEFHTNIILASSFGIPIHTNASISLPAPAEAQLDITPASLEIDTSQLSAGVARLKLKKPKQFPWVLSRKDQKRTRFSINLPVLTGHNGIEQTGGDLVHYKWGDAKVTVEDASFTTLQCDVIQTPYLPERLEQAFERVANSPCCGDVKAAKDKSLTLARLYYICCALANEKLTLEQKRQLQKEYFSLFASKSFNKILLRILEQDTFLHISPKEASSNHPKSIQVRNNIRDYLNDRNVRDRIRQRICEVLTRTLYAAYTQEQQALSGRNAASPVLILRNIGIGKHVELLWQFQLQMQDK